MPVDQSLIQKILMGDKLVNPYPMSSAPNVASAGFVTPSGGLPTPVSQEDVMRNAPTQIGAAQQNQSFFSQIGKAFGQLGKALETPGFRETLARIGGSIANPGTWQARLGEQVAGINQMQVQSQRMQRYLAKLMSNESVTANDVQGMTSEQIAQANQLATSAKNQQALSQYYQGSVAAQGTPQERGIESRKELLLRQALEEGAPQKVGAVVGPSGVNEETLFMFDPNTREFIPISSGTTTRGTSGDRGITPGQQQNLYFRYHSNLIKEVEREMPKADSFYEGQFGPQPVWNSPTLQEEFKNKLALKIRREQQAGNLPIPWMGVTGEQSQLQGPPAPSSTIAPGKLKIGPY